MNDQILWLAADPSLFKIVLCLGVIGILRWIASTQ